MQMCQQIFKALCVCVNEKKSSYGCNFIGTKLSYTNSNWNITSSINNITEMSVKKRKLKKEAYIKWLLDSYIYFME